MYKYGITSKSGKEDIVVSEKKIDDFMKYLKSAEFVPVELFNPTIWTSETSGNIFKMDFIMFSLSNIESICFIISENEI